MCLIFFSFLQHGFVILQKNCTFLPIYLVGLSKGSTFAAFFDDVCSQGTSYRRDAHALTRTKNGISTVKRKEQL